MQGLLSKLFYCNENKLDSYRCVEFYATDPTPESHSYSNWVRINKSAIGYTFGIYKVPDGTWSFIVTPDDLRFTYLWGTDFRSTNGQCYTDEQIQYFINARVEEIERRLDMVIRKRKVRCNATERKLAKSEYMEWIRKMWNF